jgi:hypothetical protein
MNKNKILEDKKLSYRRPNELPKHVAGYYVIKLHVYTPVHLLVLLKKIIYLINVRITEYIKRNDQKSLFCMGVKLGR